MKIRNWLILLVMVGLLAPSGAALAAKQVAYISVDTLKTLLGFQDALIIDVRAPKDWDQSDRKIKGAVRQDPKQVKAWASKLDKDKEIVLYCAFPNEGTSARVAQEMMEMGFTAVEVLKGGWKAWEAAKYPTEPKGK